MIVIWMLYGCSWLLLSKIQEKAESISINFLIFLKWGCSTIRAQLMHLTSCVILISFDLIGFCSEIQPCHAMPCPGHIRFQVQVSIRFSPTCGCVKGRATRPCAAACFSSCEKPSLSQLIRDRGVRIRIHTTHTHCSNLQRDCRCNYLKYL